MHEPEPGFIRWGQGVDNLAYLRAIPRQMPLNPDQLTKPIRKLRKLLKTFHGIPPPAKVHKLRTLCRRVEANLHAVGFDQTRNGRRLLKAITPIRKTAGKVRDMDVLTGLASQLSINNRSESETFGEAPVELLQYLGSRRFRLAQRLDGVVTSERGSALKRLKRFSGWTSHQLKRVERPSSELERWQTDPMATAIYLSSSLSEWPRLNRDNLHAFRLRVKQLRYTLDLSSYRDRKLVSALESLKDKIGEWHDWCELETIALNSIHANSVFCNRIHSISEERLDRALAIANHVRARYFDNAAAKHNGQRHSKPVQLKHPILVSAAQMGG